MLSMNKRESDKKDDPSIRARYEAFGGIVSLKEPPSLVFLDKPYMKELGYEGAEVWNEKYKHLSAPTEVHFNLTNYCPLNCRHCTSGGGSSKDFDMTTEKIKEAIDILADMKVFHIAFGGGELFSRQDAIEIAEYAYAKGIIPNATTNGYYMTKEIAEKCRIFGQVNISMDGIGDQYGVVRGVNIFERAHHAVQHLLEAGVNTGINCVLTRANFDRLEEVLAYAHKMKLCQVLFLRLKPSGRAKDIYEEYKLTQEQSKAFYKILMKMSKKYKTDILVDCSFIPHICYHKPSQKIMSKFGVEGCDGGNILLGVRHDGGINACSHYEEYISSIFELRDLWKHHQHFQMFRERNVSDAACLNCKYFKLCRGGCPLFSLHLEGDFHVPDPECPILVEKKSRNA